MKQVWLALRILSALLVACGFAGAARAEVDIAIRVEHARAEVTVRGAPQLDMTARREGDRLLLDFRGDEALDAERLLPSLEPLVAGGSRAGRTRLVLLLRRGVESRLVREGPGQWRLVLTRAQPHDTGLRIGREEGRIRLVFEGPDAASARVESESRAWTLVFPRPLAPQALQTLSAVTVLEVSQAEENGLRLQPASGWQPSILRLPPDRLVVDLLRGGRDAVAERDDGTRALPSQGTVLAHDGTAGGGSSGSTPKPPDSGRPSQDPGRNEAAQSGRPAGGGADSSPSRQAAGGDGAPESASGETGGGRRAEQAHAESPDGTPFGRADGPGGTSGSQPARLHILADREGGLEFLWEQPAGAAVLQRGSRLLLVFDRRAEPVEADRGGLAAALHGSARSLRVVELDSGTLVSLVLTTERPVELRGGGTAWQLAFATAQIRVPVRVVPAGDAVIVPGARRAVPFTETVAGDRLVALTFPDAGQGTPQPMRFVDFALLPAPAGAIVRPLRDDLVIEPEDGGVRIARPGGLRLAHGAGPQGDHRLSAERAHGASEPEGYGTSASHRAAPASDMEGAVRHGGVVRPVAATSDHVPEAPSAAAGHPREGTVSAGDGVHRPADHPGADAGPAHVVAAVSGASTTGDPSHGPVAGEAAGGEPDRTGSPGEGGDPGTVGSTPSKGMSTVGEAKSDHPEPVHPSPAPSRAASAAAGDVAEAGHAPVPSSAGHGSSSAARHAGAQAGIEPKRPAGPEAVPASATEAKEAVPFEPPAWRTTFGLAELADIPPDLRDELRRRARARLLDPDPATARQARLELARLELADALGPEARTILALLDGSPDARRRALELAAAALAGDRGTMDALLVDPLLGRSPEAGLYRALRAAADGRWEEAARDLDLAHRTLQAYPEPLQKRLGPVIATIALQTGDPNRTFVWIDRLSRLPLERPLRERLRFLEALAVARDGSEKEAVAILRDLEREGAWVVALQAAFARLRIERDGGRITPEQALARLEELAALWRGHPWEPAMLRALGDLRAEAGRVEEALSAWRELLARFPDAAESRDVPERMRALLRAALDPAEKPRLSAGQALRLWEEHPELVVPDPPTIAALSRLAEALASTDLAGRALALAGRLDRWAGSGVKERLALLRARLLLETGRAREALGLAEELARIWSEDAERMRELAPVLARAALQAGRPERVARLEPWLEPAEGARLLFDAAAALRDLSDLIQRGPKLVEGLSKGGGPVALEDAARLVRLVAALRQAGRMEDAEAQIAAFSPHMPDDAWRDRLTALAVPQALPADAAGTLAALRRERPELAALREAIARRLEAPTPAEPELGWTEDAGVQSSAATVRNRHALQSAQENDESAPPRGGPTDAG